MLIYEDLEGVVLVGHSYGGYGGMVITGVAEHVPERVAHLVYLDGIVPRNGESLVDAVDPEARRETEAWVAREGQGWLVPLSRGPNDLPSKNMPHPHKTWSQAIRLRDPEIIYRFPPTYIRCTADQGPSAGGW